MSLINHYNEAKNKDIIGIDVNLLNDEQKNYYHKFLEKLNIANQTEEELRTIGQNELISVLPKMAEFVNLCNQNTDIDVLKNKCRELGFNRNSFLEMHILATLTNKCHDLAIQSNGDGQYRISFAVPSTFAHVGVAIEKHCWHDEEKKKEVANKIYKIITPNTNAREEFQMLAHIYSRYNDKHHPQDHLGDYIGFVDNMVKPYSQLDEYVGAPKNKKEMLDVCNYLFNDVLVYPDGCDENGKLILSSLKDDIEVVLQRDYVKEYIENALMEEKEDNKKDEIINDEQCL